MLKMHHIAIAVNNMEKTVSHYMNDIGGFIKTKVFYDEQQGINIQYLFPVDKTALPVELIQPIAEKNPVSNILKRVGVSPYHIGYETDNINTDYEKFRGEGYVCVGKMFKGVVQKRTCCFLYHNEMGLVELVESKK